jgi:hypothetical protein
LMLQMLTQSFNIEGVSFFRYEARELEVFEQDRVLFVRVQHAF